MLYLYATVVTVNPERDVFLDGTILVKGDKIADIGKTKELAEKYKDEEVVNLKGRIIIPGLISTHMHTAQNLLSGNCLDDMLSDENRNDVLDRCC